MCAGPISPSLCLVPLLVLLGPKWRTEMYRLSIPSTSGISGISWAAAAVGSTRDGGIFYVQLPLWSGWAESSSGEKAERGTVVSLQTAGCACLPACPVHWLWSGDGIASLFDIYLSQPLASTVFRMVNRYTSECYVCCRRTPGREYWEWSGRDR